MPTSTTPYADARTLERSSDRVAAYAHNQAPSAHGFHSRAGCRLRRRRRLLFPWLKGRHGGVGSLLIRLLGLVDASDLGKKGARVPVVLVRVG